MFKHITLLFLLTLGLSAGAQANSSTVTITLLVSDAQAQFVAAAIDDWHQQQNKPKWGLASQFVIQARTSSQLTDMSDAEIAVLFASSKVVIGAGIFGPAVHRLQNHLLSTNRLFFNSDHQLVALSALNGRPLFADVDAAAGLSAQRPDTDFDPWLQQQLAQHPRQKTWLMARAFWQAGGNENLIKLFNWLAQGVQSQSLSGNNLLLLTLDEAQLKANATWPKPQARVRWIQNNVVTDSLDTRVLTHTPHSQPTVVILDSQSGDRISDRAVSLALCQALAQQSLNCLVALSYWGEPAAQALAALSPYKTSIAGFIFLQDFVVGGGQAREQADAAFKQFNVPVVKAIKSFDRTHLQRQLSVDGIAADRVYYQVAMPELQGASQPLVVATQGDTTVHAASGLSITTLTPDASAIAQLSRRLGNWSALQTKANADKKIAIVYYNHPPGRHNIGADNLDVPASLWRILNDLKHAGYTVGKLPASPADLLEQLQAQGVNLPNQPTALRAMSSKIARLSQAQYQAYFETLPPAVQQEMVYGPLGYLHEQIKNAVAQGWWTTATEQLHHSMEEIHHLLEGLDHPSRERVIKLLAQLEQQYQAIIAAASPVTDTQWQPVAATLAAIVKTGIEGLQGWGPAPGKVMVWENQVLLPGLQFGNVFLGPQPPRGWEINEELLHANLAFAPPHQYLAFYHYLRDEFKADAIVHLGRHSTYEFLPRRSVGLMDDDYARLIADDIPGIYPYIVDGVGEGIQAKRRGLAVMVDHLTPPLQSTPLYDELLQLRQLIESFEANHESNQSALKAKLVSSIREKVERLELKDELAEFMSAELAVMGIGFDEVDDDMLVHEIGHYLTEMQERFMPMGLHVFGQTWNTPALDMMLNSMAPTSNTQKDQWRDKLAQSPTAERDALLNGLAGGFVAPGVGNDPIRTPESLPTGRNFYALDSSLIPSPTAWALGRDMAENARQTNAQSPQKSEAIVLWASDVVRDEGVMIAFGLNMMGIEPVWNSRGLVQGLRVMPLTENAVRRNTVFTSSGLFRDLYAKQMYWVNQAVLMALAQSARVIERDYPALTLALHEALRSLDDVDIESANIDGKTGIIYNAEPLTQNQVAAHWVTQAQALLATNVPAAQAGKLASLRVFGTAPGSYGAGINRMVERSGAWQQRQEVADVYLKRMGHSYGLEAFGAPARKVFEQNLSNIENTYLGRSSNLYGLMDNNDAFDYFGGLSLAVETLTGKTPNSFVIHHADQDRVVTQPLHAALKQELRGRFLNPAWLKGLMAHDYAGARTMGSEFLEYLWGWQVTNPDIINDWVWQEVKSVYMDDKYQLGLSDFLASNQNAHVKANMLAIMLVAIEKDFWQADKQTIAELAEQFAQLVIENGLPGSGHTSPNHPMLAWLEHHLPVQQWQEFSAVVAQDQRLLAAAAQQTVEQTLRTLSEIETQSSNTQAVSRWLWVSGFVLLAIFALAFVKQMRQFRKLSQQKHQP